jgi:dethiobiotin synthetase
MSTIFLTATGTEIGKTFVAVGLIEELKRRGRDVAAIKPVLSGYEEWSAPASDAARLLAALELPASEDEVKRISPWRFRAPMSPDHAARREGRTLDYDGIAAFCRTEAKATPGVLLIEGIGGVMVPLDGQHTTLDLMAELRCPAVLVTGSYLGTISHTLTALGALRQRRVPVTAIVMSESEESSVPLMDNAASIARFAGEAPVLALPRLAHGEAHAVFGALADLVK